MCDLQYNHHIFSFGILFLKIHDISSFDCFLSVTSIFIFLHLRSLNHMTVENIIFCFFY